MSLLANLHGGLALALLCGLIFAEEAGVPLPLLPGDLLLVAGGAMVATGTVVGYLFVPAAIAASISGGLVGFGWAGLAGERGLSALARRVHGEKQLHRVTARLRGATAGAVTVARLVPGLRVYTTLVAGALRVPRRTFAIGLALSTALWVGIFSALGFLIGPALQGPLRHADALLLQGALLVVMGIAAYVMVRRIPARRSWPRGVPAISRRWATLGAAFVDLGTVGSVVAGLNSMGRALLGLQGIDDWFDGAVLLLLGAIAYALVSRRSLGRTAGEALFAASYAHAQAAG